MIQKAIIYELSNTRISLYARPTASRWERELRRPTLNNPHFGQLLYNFHSKLF